LGASTLCSVPPSWPAGTLSSPVGLLSPLRMRGPGAARSPALAALSCTAAGEASGGWRPGARQAPGLCDRDLVTAGCEML
jgi:hypothetical protein